MMNRSGREFPPRVYWLLFVTLWALLITTLILLYQHREGLSFWKLYLYVGLLAVYLLAERRSHRASEQVGQRVHEALRYLLSLSWWVLMIGAVLEFALWSKDQWGITLFGVTLTLGGSALRVWSIATLGRYFSGHIETWQGQPVIEAGPYRWLRHPGYAGNILQVIGMPLILNAYAVLLLSALVAGLFIRRLLWEEDYLSQQLPVYKEYMARTKRLIPGIW